MQLSPLYQQTLKSLTKPFKPSPTANMASALAATAASAALPYLMKGVAQGIKKVKERRARRRSLPQPPGYLNSSRRRPKRRVSRAPVALGSTTRQSTNFSQRQSATEQFTPVAAGQNKFSVFWHSTEPVDELAFPRLSQMSSQYQNFSVNALRYTFTPNIGTNTTGTIYLGFTPDVSTPLPTNAEDMKGLWGSVASNIWKPVTLIVPASAFNKIARTYYTRRTTTTSGDNM